MPERSSYTCWNPGSPEAFTRYSRFVLGVGRGDRMLETLERVKLPEWISNECFGSDGEPKHSFEIHSGNFTLSSVSSIRSPLPTPSTNRLYLVNASGLPGFQQVYELLSGMEFYTPDPEMMRNELDTTGSADILDADGENTASVLDRLRD